MLDLYKQLTTNQYASALATLRACIVACPDDAWDVPVVNHPFCRVAFHTLFFADFHLCETEQGLRDQDYHREHADLFGDYEELEPREPVRLYQRDAVMDYLEFCRKKSVDVVASETAESLAGPSGFERRKITRAELHVYNMRHIHHHAAQLSLRLRIDHGIDIPWFGSGWPAKD